MKRLKYNFFDGIELHEDLDDKFFQPINGNFDFFSKAYIEVKRRHYNLWKSESKILSTFKYFTKEQLDTIAKKYNLQVSITNNENYPSNDYYIYLNGSATIPYIIQHEEYDILYSIGGSRNPEYIYIYGVFANNIKE